MVNVKAATADGNGNDCNVKRLIKDFANGPPANDVPRIGLPGGEKGSSTAEVQTEEYLSMCEHTWRVCVAGVCVGAV